ncbi:signal peptidase I [Alicyclobacillus fodiniaquatilis]|uniref:Signal peptidase I n=1 Tax=Alicyclobacillus fodiniaquatilis TaxID=1661150 RepID=A0ABW4JED1_9BACL
MQATVEMMKRHIQTRGWLDVPAQGVSMFPWIREGDICRFTYVKQLLDIQPGDVLLFHTESGHLVGHRVRKMETVNQKVVFICKGDSNLQNDAPVYEDQVIGRLAYVRKPKMVLQMDGWIADLWKRFVNLTPHPSRILRWYLSRQAMRRE